MSYAKVTSPKLVTLGEIDATITVVHCAEEKGEGNESYNLLWGERLSLSLSHGVGVANNIVSN